MTEHQRHSGASSAAPSGKTAPADEAPLQAASPPPGPVVVGIGTSAGGLTALKTFFAHVPERSGLAWVIVVHLSPEHESHLAQILQPHVQMPVEQVTETVKLEPDRVYVIPPNRNLSAVDTHLRLTSLEERRRERAPIDHFFRTLSKTHDGHAIGIVLTGTGSDGALGIKAIKERNGLTVVQDPNEAEYDGMPQSAIVTGMVDLVLPLAGIPEAVLRFARTQPRVPVPADGEDARAEERRLLQKVFAQLRARTGRDFTRYKRSTILRRILRRMQLAHLEELPAYLALLRDDPDETRRLADDLLITVTNFFRDREVFEALEAHVVPTLFKGKGPGDDVRAWSVGCATGEEAYSLAMLLLEEAARREARGEAPPRLQVFASDLHERSLGRAREGFYPGDIEADVSPERLKRFFVQEDGGYRIQKELRDLVVFAPHNLLADPPFSRLDLVACRNVLIYLQRDVQQEVVELFHYALRPDGWLVLGTSETVDGADLFRVEDKQRCVYRKRNVPAREPRLPVFPVTPSRRADGREREAPGAYTTTEPLPYGVLHQRMVERYAPPSVLVSPDDKVVHLSEHAGRYLQVPGGEPTTSVYRLVREELRVELRSLLHRARSEGKAVHSQPIAVRFNGETAPVVLHARPALDPAEAEFALVIFDEREAAAAPAPADGGEAAASADARALEAELALARQRLQAVIEEYETSQEELKASNEELQSANEELRSTLEELETSKEELQSMNEELQTVNQENRHKVEELGQFAGDLQNLLAATDIATLFLDRDLRILRFTPRVTALFNIRPTDRTRPLSDFTHRLGYDALDDDARRVLDTLVPVEREVEDEKGRWYLTRMRPYRSAEDRIEGVVITFVDITERKRAEEEVHKAKVYAESIVETLHEPLLVLHPDLRVKSVNQAFYDHFEVREAETIGRLVYDLGNGQWDIPELRTLLEDVLPDSNVFNDYEVAHDFEDIGERVMLVNARRLDHVQLILLGIRDITEKKRAEEAVRRSEAQQAFIVRLSDALRPLADPVAVQAEAARVLGEHLDVGRAYYVEIDEANDAFVVARDWHRPEVPSHARRYPLEDWPMPWLIDGQTWVIRDVETDPAMPDEQRTSYRGNDIGACIVVPLVKEGRLVATFVVNQPEPRAWTDAEVALVEETAERTWAAIEHAEAEAKRREAEERFRALARASSDIFYRMSPDWREMRQLSGGGVLADTKRPNPAWLEKYIHPADRELISKAIREAIETKSVFELEHRVLQMDGRTGWVLSRAVPILGPDGEIVEWFGAASNITARHQALAALRQSEERYRLLVQGTTEYAHLMLNPEGEITMWSAGAERIFGYTAEEAVGRSGAILFTEEDQTAGVPAFEIETATREGRALNERPMARQDGSTFWASGITTALRHEDGRLRGFAKVLRDNTERRAAEEALRTSEARFRAVADLVPDLLWRSEASGYTTWYNRRWLEYTGQTPEEAEGWGWAQAVHPDDRARAEANWRRSTASGEPLKQEVRLHRHDGTGRWFLVRAEPVRDGTGAVQQWLGAATDMHEQRTAMERLEERVEERTAQVRALAHRLTMAEQEERRRISQILHDDLQQLLYGVEMKMGLIRQDLQERAHDVDAREQLARDLDEVRAWVDQAVTTTRQLTVDLSPPILQKEGLADALQWLERQMQELHGLTVTVEAAHAFHLADENLRVLLFQIVRELLFNVKKHSGTDRATVRLTDAEASAGAPRLVIHVLDEGRGFDAAAVAAREEAGGFGLYSIQERLRLLGGHLEVHSRPGEGTHIEVHAPTA